MLAIDIKTIAHAAQRYPTCGDWWWLHGRDSDVLVIRVSSLRDWRYEALIGVHELVEALLCTRWGVDEENVTAFDLKFERKKARGRHPNDAEAGDDPRAPYHRAHMAASRAERVLARLLRVNWHDYETAVNAL